MFTVVSVNFLRWYDAAMTQLFGEVITAEYGKAEILIREDYDLEWGRVFWQEAVVQGLHGEIQPYQPPTPEELRAMMPPLETWRLDAALQLRDPSWDVAAKILTLPIQQRVVYNSQWKNKGSFMRLDDLVESGVRVWFSISPETMDEIWNEGLAF